MKRTNRKVKRTNRKVKRTNRKVNKHRTNRKIKKRKFYKGISRGGRFGFSRKNRVAEYTPLPTDDPDNFTSIGPSDQDDSNSERDLDDSNSENTQSIKQEYKSKLKMAKNILGFSWVNTLDPATVRDKYSLREIRKRRAGLEADEWWTEEEQLQAAMFLLEVANYDNTRRKFFDVLMRRRDIDHMRETNTFFYMEGFNSDSNNLAQKDLEFWEAGSEHGLDLKSFAINVRLSRVGNTTKGFYPDHPSLMAQIKSTGEGALSPDNPMVNPLSMPPIQP